MEEKVSVKQLLTAVAKIVTYIKEAIKGVKSNIDKKVDDAPKNGKPHVRKDGAWEEFNIESGETMTDEEFAAEIDKILNGE